MKLKDFLINLLLTFSSIYIPFFFLNVFFYSRENSINKNNQELQIGRLEEDINERKEALRSGYLPFYYPHSVKKYSTEISVYPVGGLPNTKTYLCNEGYGLIKYTSDRFGLRNSEKKWGKVTKQDTIFLIGDSFTHGACVNEKFTISSLVEKNTNLNTINLGTGSSGPYEYYAVNKSIIDPLIKSSKNDNVVIVIFYDNDNINYNIQWESYLEEVRPVISISKTQGGFPTNEYKNKINKIIKGNYPTSIEKVELEIDKHNNLHNSEKDNLSKFLTLYNLRSTLKKEILKYFIYNPNQFPYIFPISNFTSPSQRVINHLGEICRKNCYPIIAYIPSRNNIGYSEISNKKYKLKLEEKALSLGIIFIDGEDVINRNNNEDYAPEGMHLSLEGYKKFSKLISNEIENILR